MTEKTALSTQTSYLGNTDQVASRSLASVVVVVAKQVKRQD